jgi:hypothetical protein
MFFSSVRVYLEAQVPRYDLLISLISTPLESGWVGSTTMFTYISYMIINSSTYGDSADMNIDKPRRSNVIGYNLKENVYFRTVSHDKIRKTKFCFRLVLLQM